MKLLIVLGMFMSSVAFAQQAPPCLDKNGQNIPVENDVVLKMKTSTHNGSKSRAHISGVISQIYRDATGHHHWQATIGNNRGDTIEVVYDEKFGATPTPTLGESVEACGDYVTANGGKHPSPDGAVLHWIHASDTSSHPDGYTILGGQLYGNQVPGHP